MNPASPLSQKLQAAEVLESAAFVLMVPGWHCKNSPSVDEHGGEVSSDSPSACSFCAMGALSVAARTFESKVFWKARDALNKEVPGAIVTIFNDAEETTPEMVAEKMLAAADALRGQA